MARSEDVIEVWRVDLDAPADLATLTSEERARAERNPRWGAARAALRQLLDGRELRFTEHGKPWVEGGPRFNLSHTGALALIALSATREVGIDVERADRRAQAVIRSLTATERQLLGAAPTAEQLLQTWCRKEALAKAIGGGLNWRPQDFDTTAPGGYALTDLDAGTGYVASLAVQGTGGYSISPRRMPSATAAARSDTPSRS
jgi:4'-phosphopantetheinyl transferase